jgi:hypothetical protein
VLRCCDDEDDDNPGTSCVNLIASSRLPNAPVQTDEIFEGKRVSARSAAFFYSGNYSFLVCDAM